MLVAVGNMMLDDINHILDIQVTSENGTLVSNNPNICFTPSQAWGSRTDSHIEYELSSVCWFDFLRIIMIL